MEHLNTCIIKNNKGKFQLRVKNVQNRVCCSVWKTIETGKKSYYPES